jgi:adenylate cyclase
VSRRIPSPGSEFLDSIAVLPFENAGDDPEMDYLSDGITASIINNLSQVHSLRVVPRTTVSRYKGKLSDLTQAGRELRVRVVLTGRVAQRGDNLTINVELMRRGANRSFGVSATRAVPKISSLFRPRLPRKSRTG